MRIERVWAMPNKWTFTIKPIKKLLEEEMNGIWIDPYAGLNSPAQLTNDINPSMPTKYHLESLAFLKQMKLISDPIDGCLFDPPYSVHQSVEVYEGKKQKNASINMDVISRVIKPGGKAICFGWNSNGLGKNRGFELERILLVAHGSSHNDTIVTVEKKINSSLFI